ncbi:MlaD family protein [Pedobacter sp. Du54]|uniref:MlaD family protein n=1 Tax=Pedobacter anseongensis TaxID=3133439 RepID=UPI0030AADF6C
MENPIQNNLKLGIFVSLGLIILIFSLYMIGKNKSLFGANFELRSRFANVNGLRKGNNVLYSGIQAGTVKDITLINDTIIEVTFSIDDKLRNFINKEAIVSISNEGLMGNKIVQIQPHGSGNKAAMRDLLPSIQGPNMNEMLQVLARTNQNVEGISTALKVTVQDIHKSALLALLKDQKTAQNLMMSIIHIERAAANVEDLSSSLKAGVKNERGTVGMLLSDTLLANTLRQAALEIRSIASRADATVLQLERTAKMLDSGARSENGLVYLMLRDTVLLKKLQATMDNVQNGTAGFNQNMEALKSNILFRGYFKKLEKEKAKSKPTIK